MAQEADGAPLLTPLLVPRSTALRPARRLARAGWPRRPRLPRIVRHQGAVLVVGSPVPPGADAITFGRFVFVRRGHEHSTRLIAHELVHVRQYADEGLVRFLLGYVGRYIVLRALGWPHVAAYRRLPAEVHAEWSSVGI